MCPSVGGVIELVGPDCVVYGFGISFSLVIVVLGVVECDGYAWISMFSKASMHMAGNLEGRLS